MATGIAIDSDDEPVTAMCRRYRDNRLYPQIDTDVTLTRFQGAGAVRANIVPVLTAGVDFITGSGHGFPERFTGQNRGRMLEVGQYTPAEVVGTIVHLLSCETAERLGVDVVANGCRAFFGYDDPFVFPPQEAQMFLEADSEIDRALARGKTAKEAFDAAIRTFNRHIVTLLQSGNNFAAAALIHSRNHLCAPSKDAKWGKTDAKLPATE